MDIKLCVFDMDGLLLDSERKMWMKNGTEVLHSWGLEFNLDFYKTIMGSTRDYASKGFKEYYGQDFDAIKYYDLVSEANLKQIQNGDIPKMKGAEELLSFLKENNIPMTVATSTRKEMADMIMNKLGWYKYFDMITCGNEVNNSKPAPDIFLKAISKYNVKPENALVFEDAHNGVLASRNAGIPYCVVPDLALLTDEDLSKAYKVLDSLLDAIDIFKNR